MVDGGIAKMFSSIAKDYSHGRMREAENIDQAHAGTWDREEYMNDMQSRGRKAGLISI